MVESKKIVNLLHSSIEASFLGKRISHKEMADMLGISMRTYQEWRLGNNSPIAIKTIFKMLGFLEEDEILRLIKKIKKGQPWASLQKKKGMR